MIGDGLVLFVIAAKGTWQGFDKEWRLLYGVCVN
jgi:hypothetical protein